ncbi:MAG TPA: hypothetical protein DDX19_12290 [Rhodopirellula baltica]|nr:hypothetical protein [Rhodopirellula baltica]
MLAVIRRNQSIRGSLVRRGRELNRRVVKSILNGSIHRVLRAIPSEGNEVMSQLLEATQSECQVSRMLQRIESVLLEHEALSPYASDVDVSVYESTIVLEGTLPTAELQQQLVPSIRQAGVLWRIKNNVAVEATATKL